MLKDTLDFFKESKPIYRLHLIFLYNHYHIYNCDREISELENNLLEYDIIYLAKYSMIYNCIINFKKWFVYGLTIYSTRHDLLSDILSKNDKICLSVTHSIYGMIIEK
jgi:hypothetical protein